MLEAEPRAQETIMLREITELIAHADLDVNQTIVPASTLPPLWHVLSMGSARGNLKVSTSCGC